jgi:hypothetical protein
LVNIPGGPAKGARFPFLALGLVEAVPRKNENLITFRLSEELDAQIREIAAREDLSVSNAIRRLLRSAVVVDAKSTAGQSRRSAGAAR